MRLTAKTDEAEEARNVDQPTLRRQQLREERLRHPDDAPEVHVHDLFEGRQRRVLKAADARQSRDIENIIGVSKALFRRRRIADDGVSIRNIKAINANPV